jgi:hypothetical protein
MSIYTEAGYENKKEYMQELADCYDVDISVVKSAAKMIGVISEIGDIEDALLQYLDDLEDELEEEESEIDTEALEEESLEELIYTFETVL